MWVNIEFFVVWSSNSGVWNHGCVVGLWEFWVSHNSVDWGVMMSESVFFVSESVSIVTKSVFEAVMSSLPVITVMFESMSKWMSNTMVDGVTTEVWSTVHWSVSSKLVVWDCHVIEWLVEDVMLNVTFWEMAEAWAPDASILFVVLLLTLDSFLIVFPSIIKFGSECSFILMWSKFMVSVWLISVGLVVVDWVVFWHVVRVMVIRVSSNVVC